MSISLSYSTASAKSWSTYPGESGSFNSNSSSLSISYADSGGTYHNVATVYFKTIISATQYTTSSGYAHGVGGYFEIEKGSYWSSYSSSIYLKITSGTLYGATVSSRSYTSYASLSSLGSGSWLNYVSGSVTVGQGPASKTYYSGGTVYIAESSSGASAASRSISSGNYMISYATTKFTCSFSAGSDGTGSFNNQTLYWGQTVSDPGSPTPNQPAARTITCTFKSNGDQSDASSWVSVQDTRTFSGWSPSLSTSITSDTSFTAQYSLTYATSNQLLLPSFSPTKTGYNFVTWKIGSTDIGNTPGAAANYTFGSGGTTAYTANATYTPEERTFVINYYTLRNESMERITDSQGRYLQEVKVYYDATGSYTLPSILGYSNPTDNKIYYVANTGETVYVSSIDGTLANGTEFIALYTIMPHTITLKLNGGSIEGSTSNIVINYDILSGIPDPDYGGKNVINIRNTYQPTMDNSTFIGWIDDNTELYTDVVIPVEQIATNNPDPTFTADFMNIGKFVYRRGTWHAVINTWVYDNGAWRGQASTKVGVLETNTVSYVYKDDEWHIEKGKEDTALD